jgi:hypothetical protein
MSNEPIESAMTRNIDCTRDERDDETDEKENIS